MLARGFSLSGDWLLFWSGMAFGRYVLLEAHGELPLRSSETEKGGSEDDAEARRSFRTGSKSNKICTGGERSDR